MNVTLVTALVALAPVCMLVFGSAVMFFREKGVPSFLQLFGAGCLMVVVLAHLREALHLFPWMRWAMSIALVITSTSGVPFLVLSCFPWDICFMSSRRQTRECDNKDVRYGHEAADRGSATSRQILRAEQTWHRRRGTAESVLVHAHFVLRGQVSP